MNFILILLYLLSGKPVYEVHEFPTEAKCYEIGTTMIEIIDDKADVEWIVAGCIEIPGEKT